MKRICLALFFLAIAVGAMAQADKPRFISPDSVAYGRTYADWSAAWEQWADSIPVSNHPLFDNGDCSVGQSGPVWFLGGKFCALDNPDCGYDKVVRSCTIPSNKALYIPIFTAEYSVLEMNDPKAQIADMRSYAAAAIDDLTNLAFEVDGLRIPRLKERFRVQSNAFVFTLPDENLFSAIGEGPYEGGTYYPAIDDGIYVMLAPLSPGLHLVHFHAYAPQWNFTLDVTYQLLVKN